MDNLVDTKWLTDELAAPDLVICDATVYPPGDGRDARKLYQAGRLPGARFFDLDVIADPDSPLPHMVPAASRFERLVGALGIGNANRVVFYDQLGLFSAARAWWLMRLFGHRQAAVLDGGLPKWQREGRPLHSGPSPLPLPAHYRTSYRALRLRGLGDMLDNVKSARELVIDARSGERFYGRAPEPRAGLRSGHIPGASSVPHTDLLSSGQTLLAPAALRARFAAAGVDGKRGVVTSCGSGLTAAVLTLGLAVAGLPEGALYDGSWVEWGGRSDTPVAT